MTSSLFFRYTLSLTLAIAMLPTLIATHALAGDNFVTNGDIETIEDSGIVGWQSIGEVRQEAVTGMWRRYTVKFNSGRFNKVNFYFWTRQGSTGSVWIDNVTCEDITIANGSFENLEKDKSPTSWTTDYFQKQTFIDTTRASDGKHSVRFTFVNEAQPEAQAIQRGLKVQPNRDYAISYDVFVGDDFQGTAGALIYDFSAHDHITTNFYEADLAHQLATRDICEGRMAVLSPSNESPAGIEQAIELDPEMNLYLNMDINTKGFEGNAGLSIEDPATGEVIQSVLAKPNEKQWQTLSVPLKAQISSLHLRVIAEGTGEVSVDNIAITPPRIVPPLQQVTWSPSSDNFEIPQVLSVSVEGPAGVALEGGLGLLTKDLEAYGSSIERTDISEADLRIHIGENYAIEDKGPEAYRLSASASGIVIEAEREAGAFYGLMTVLQLLQQKGDGAVALACDVTDYPDMPMRGVLYGDIEQAARWKMNTYMFSSGYPDDLNPDKKQEFEHMLQNCERLNLEPIPYYLSLHGGYYVQKQNPNLAAGIRVENEAVELHGSEPAQLKNKYVIRTKLSDVVLTSNDGKRRYRLGKDYEVIDGDIGWPYAPDAEVKLFSVARLPGSAIPDGATVLASYDYVSQWRERHTNEVHIAYCPIEPEAREIMSGFHKRLAADYPLKYIFPSLCLAEFAPPAEQLSTDGRVIEAGKTPIQLFIEVAKSYQEAVKAGNPDATTILWSGEMNDYAKFAGPRLPRDIHIEVWGYDANWPAAYGWEIIDYWSKLGHNTSVMSWDNLRNVRGWAQVVAKARERGYPCQGMISSCWFGRTGGFEESAIVSWNIPEQGDRNYVSIEQTRKHRH